VESAEFVQVKKPQREDAGNFVASWKIDLRQLDDLINLSQTGAYWLFDPEGSIYVVPARLVDSLRRANGVSTQKTLTVTRAGIRSIAIGLDQFLVDLFAGIWIGTSAESALRVARGADKAYQPEHLFVVNITRAGSRDEGG
jgi:hypothetical protein